MTGISETCLRSGVPVACRILAAVALFAGLAGAQDLEEAAAIAAKMAGAAVGIAPDVVDGAPAEPPGEDPQADAQEDDIPLERDAEADVAQAPTEEAEPPIEADPLVSAHTPPPSTPIIRDPFWPPGYDPNPAPKAPPTTNVVSSTPTIEHATPTQPPVELPEPTPAHWTAATRQLKPIIGRSVDPEGNEQHFALLNNRLLAIGQTVSANTSLFAFSWRIGRITATGVEWIPVEARRLQDGKRFPPPQTEAF